MKTRNHIFMSAAVAISLAATSAQALKTEELTLKGNRQVEYTKLPGAVDSFGAMFTEGMLYGRLRSNNFYWDAANDKANSTDDHLLSGVGASLVYKSGEFYGVSATLGAYGSVVVSDDNIFPGTTTNYGKTGKDMFRLLPDGSEQPMGVLAQAYLEYRIGKTDVKAGRQLIESALIASNDTKMIPNAFEAVVAENRDLPDTKVRLGYLVRQKLRNHQTFHSILAYQSRLENDDAAVHKGLSVDNIRAMGGDTDADMVLLTVENASVPNLKLKGDYYHLDGFFGTLVAEANYKIPVGAGWSLTPGVRYLRQMDDGAGRIGGAAVGGAFAVNQTPDAADLASYSNPYSVDASMWAGRLVLANGPFSLMGGYSSVADDADLIAPWRGFPTAGYTRSMGQYNWTAGTDSWMLQAKYDFGKAGLLPGFFAAIDFADMDYDDRKIQAGTISYTDRHTVHFDLTQTFDALPDTELKFRCAVITADKKPADTLDYQSYSEYRLELNYFF